MIEVKKYADWTRKKHVCLDFKHWHKGLDVTICSFYHLLPIENKWTGLHFSGFKPYNWQDNNTLYKGYKHVIIQKKRKLLEK